MMTNLRTRRAGPWTIREVCRLSPDASRKLHQALTEGETMTNPDTPEPSVLARQRAEDAELCEELRKWHNFVVEWGCAERGDEPRDPARHTRLSSAMNHAAARIEALSAALAEACHDRDKAVAEVERMREEPKPIPYPNGDDHHTDFPLTDEDKLLGGLLAHDLGGLFIDVEPDSFGNPDFLYKDSYFYSGMTSTDVWSRVSRALRIHGLRVVND